MVLFKFLNTGLLSFKVNKPYQKKTGVLKLNDVYKWQFFKLMLNTITGFDVDHNRFTLASSANSHNKGFTKKLILLIKI